MQEIVAKADAKDFFVNLVRVNRCGVDPISWTRGFVNHATERMSSNSLGV